MTFGGGGLSWRLSETGATIGRMSVRRPWRWEWAGTAASREVVPWMRAGHGHDGALHSVVLFLVTNAQAYASNPEWAFRPMWEIDERLDDRPRPPRGTIALLEELEAFGTIEPRGDDRTQWRALPRAVEAIEESYADRHPMTTDGAPEAPYQPPTG
jgi:hypothetical protein